jgi:O-antigen/teichoic acid export membrane protein
MLPQEKNIACRFIAHPLARGTAIYVFTESINKSLVFLTLPIVTRYLMPAEYGIVATLSVVSRILLIFTGVTTHSAISVTYFKLDNKQFQKYISNILLIFVVSSAFIFLLVFLFNKQLSILFVIQAKLIFVAFYFACCQFIMQVNLALWQIEQRPVSYGAYQISQTILSIGLLILFVVILRQSWKGQVIATAITFLAFAGLSLIIFFIRGYLHVDFSWAFIKDSLLFSIPVIPHELSSWVKTGLDRIFLNAFVGLGATGIYAIGYQVGMTIAMAAGAFNQAWVPFLFRTLSEITPGKKLRLVKFTYIYFIAILLVSLIVSLAAPFILRILLGRSYWVSAHYVAWIAFGASATGLYYMVVNYIIFLKKTHLVAAVTVLSSVVHAILSYTLIKAHGAIGAAQATAISYFLTFLGIWILSAKVYPMPWLFWRKEKTAYD